MTEIQADEFAKFAWFGAFLLGVAFGIVGLVADEIYLYFLGAVCLTFALGVATTMHVLKLR